MKQHTKYFWYEKKKIGQFFNYSASFCNTQFIVPLKNAASKNYLVAVISCLKSRSRFYLLILEPVHFILFFCESVI